MSQTLKLVQQLVANGEGRISEHGYDELAADNIQVRDILEGAASAELVEDYPDYFKGPCVLVLQWDQASHPVHVLWGIALKTTTPATVVTAYRPETVKWSEDFNETMTDQLKTKLVHEGDYVAEVTITLMETEDAWSPHLSVADALKLDEVREALRKGDLKSATRLARVFRLTPVE